MDYSDCKCNKKLIDPLIEECTENDDQTKIINITVENENNYVSCIVYIVLMIVAFTIFIAITVYLIYYNWYLNNNNNNDADNDHKNKNLMNVIIKNGHNRTDKY